VANGARGAAALVAALASVALLAAVPSPRDTTTYIDTTATATVDFPPDRLFVAVDVESEAGAATTIGPADLDAAVARLTATGIPATSVLKRYVTTADPRWKQISTDLDPRPYGIVLLVFPKPSRTALTTLTGQTLPAAFERPLGSDTFAEVGGAWYGLDDCRRLRVAARKGALALARARGERLARIAGFTLDTSGGVRAEAGAPDNEPDPGEQNYVCGRDALPDVPPPQIHPTETGVAHDGYAEDESTIAVGWPTLPLGEPPPLVLPKDVTSLGTEQDVAATPAPLAPGTLRSSASLSAAGVAPASACAYDRALAGALALALQRAAVAGRATGLVPDHPLRIADAANYRALCPSHAPADPAPVARIDETFAAAGSPNRWGNAHLEASGSARVRVPADVARFAATLPASVAFDDVVRALAAAGVKTSALRPLPGATNGVEGYVGHPTAAAMQSLDRALAGLIPAGSATVRAYDYAVDDCAALSERAVREAVGAARTSAQAEAARRGAHLRAVVAVDAGPIRERNCGPRVLEALPLLPEAAAAAAAPSTDAAVTADATVRLLFSL
jgi:hypothetical protein